MTSEMLWLREIGKRLPGKTAARFFRCNDEISQTAQVAITNSKKEGMGANIFSTIEVGPNFTESDINAEATTLIVAGSDSTAVSLTYLVWSVLSHPEIQHELETEVATLPAGFGDADTENLPVLNAVIQETLRLYGAVNTPMPRVVPAGGVTMGGYYLPQGITVTTQAHTIHRDSTLFPEPLK
jgi:cytochrome P450